jgi:hypothetical protein
MALATCTACRRHVREEEAACPFCGGNIAAVVVRIPLRRDRAAIMFAAVVAGAGASACESGGDVPVYGAPIYDTGVADTGATDAGPVPEASIDSGSMDTSSSDTADSAADAEDVRVLPPYGAPSTPVEV